MTGQQQEQALTRLWQEALDLPQPVDTFGASFTELGGDSIAATLLMTRLKAQWQVDLPMDALFDDMTLPRLAALLEQALRDNKSRADLHPEHGDHLQPDASPMPSLPSITRQPRDQALHLSHSQRRMWLVQSFAPDTTAYNVTYALRLQGTLDREALATAVTTVWSRHDTFRTSFGLAADGKPRQIVANVKDGAAADVPAVSALHHHDLRATPTDQREAALHHILEQAARQPLDLLHGPLWHIHLVQLTDQDHVLTWIAHHILVDLWANQVIAREIAHVYSHLTANKPLHLPEVALDCADHGHWQNTPAFDAFIQPQLEHWLKHLAGLPPTNLATDHPMSPDWYRSAQRVTHSLAQEGSKRLQQFASSLGCTPFMVLLAALAVMLGRQGRQDDVGILTPIANRHHPDTAGIVASLVNTLVMRIDLSDAGATTCAALLDRVKRTTLTAYSHQDLPFDMLVERIGSQSRGHQDLPLGLQVMLNLANAPTEGIDFAGLTARRMNFNRGATQLPLTFIVDLEQTHSISLEYADTLFEPATAQALVTHFVQVLDQIMADPQQPISALRWQSPATRAALAAWNDTATPLQQPTVDAMLRTGSAQAADAPACTFAGETLTHRQLNTAAQRIADRLTHLGIGPGDRVGIHLPRSMALLIALRGVIMSGAAYVPLDPRYPAERLRDMAMDAELRLIIAADPGSVAFDIDGTPVLAINDNDNDAGKGDSNSDSTRSHADDAAPHATGDTPSALASATAPAPDDPLYIIYTSGSTGRPKGVVVPHRTVANFLASMAREPGIGAQDKLLAVTTLSFDIAVLELLLPLSVGAHIVMASEEEVMDGQALAALIQQEGITVMQATPSTWRAMLDSGWQGAGQLKALVGGEPLRPELAERLLPRCAELWNMYGPTETTVWSTCWKVDPQTEAIAIGRPIANTVVRIIDACGHECPIGVPGEIIIEGAGVAHGYWRRDMLTEERFIFGAPTPAATRHPTAYRTGDLGRWRHDGLLEHLGRLDHQIKIRGHRIEPGEIEHALTQHPQISQAVVLTHEKTAGDVRLVAYVVRQQAHADAGIAGAHTHDWQPPWRAFLRGHLPEHMVPQHLIELAAMPLLANGKLDRHALPIPEAGTDRPAEHTSQAATFTEWESRLARIWDEILGTPDIRREDNFFDLGGHSLLAMQVIERIAQQTSVRVPPRRYIFETLGQLAASYEREATTPASSAEAIATRQRSAEDDGSDSLGNKVKRWFKGLTA